MSDDPTAPVRFYVDDDARLPKTVESQLMLLRKGMVEQIASVHPSQEGWEGRIIHSLGFVKGLEKAIEICQEANKELTGQ